MLPRIGLGRTVWEGVALLQAFRFALDPTPAQERALLSHVGASRFAYNYLLHVVKAALDQRAAERTYGVAEADLTPYVNVSHYALRRRWNAVKADVAPWWAENSKEAYSDGAKRVSQAMTNFFDSRTGRRAGKPAGFPTFHRRGTHESMRFTTGSMRLEPDLRHVVLPTLGRLKTHESTIKLARRIRDGKARILSAGITREAGRWFVGFTVEVARTAAPARTTRRVIGIDVGIKTLYVGATGAGEHILTVENPRHTRSAELQLRKAQRNLSRKDGPAPGHTPSNRWLIARTRVTRIHAGIANRRLDLIHRTTSGLVRDFDVIAIENLNVAGMVRNRSLAKAISDAGFGEFARQLGYKASWAGVELVVADRFYPSSKTCSGCGAVKTKLSLSEREYHCTTCGLVIDRDVNAATNLARLGESTTAGSSPAAGRGGPQKTPPDPSGAAAAEEASTLQQPQPAA